MNPYLAELESDFLYHLGYSKSENLEQLFGDVKFAVVGGSGNRMKKFAEAVANEFNLSEEEKKQIDISRTDRFSFYKIGPILSISHGMGVPSVSILLHELIKLLKYAKACDPIIIRIGTCGGIGIDPGTVVVTNKAVNAFCNPEHIAVILGKNTPRPTDIDLVTAKELFDCSIGFSHPVVLGTTMCTDDFYEGQGRLDGAVCEFTKEEQAAYIKELQSKGVVNIEMECTVLASLCAKASVKCAICCVALVDRTKGDQVQISTETYKAYQERPRVLLLKYLRKKLEEIQHPFCNKKPN